MKEKYLLKIKKDFLKPNGKYYALLIGNSKYTNGWEDLVSPINDINAIKEVLDEKYDFEEILMVNNGTKKDIYKAFTDLSKLTTTNDYVLIITLVMVKLKLNKHIGSQLMVVKIGEW